MPLHDFKCKECGTEFEKFQNINNLKEVEECPTCGMNGVKLWTLSKGGLSIFKPDFFNDITTEPIYIESRKQLRDICKQYGVKSQYIEDSYTRSY